MVSEKTLTFERYRVKIIYGPRRIFYFPDVPIYSSQLPLLNIQQCGSSYMQNLESVAEVELASARREI